MLLVKKYLEATSRSVVWWDFLKDDGDKINNTLLEFYPRLQNWEASKMKPFVVL